MGGQTPAALGSSARLRRTAGVSWRYCASLPAATQPVARFRRPTIDCGPWSVRLWLRSSSYPTSLTQWARFSVCHCPRASPPTCLMFACASEQRSIRGQSSGAACGLPVLDRALDPEDLSDLGEIEVAIEGGAGLDPAMLNPAAALLDLDVRRGKSCRRAPTAPPPSVLVALHREQVVGTIVLDQMPRMLPPSACASRWRSPPRRPRRAAPSAA